VVIDEGELSNRYRRRTGGESSDSYRSPSSSLAMRAMPLSVSAFGFALEPPLTGVARAERSDYTVANVKRVKLDRSVPRLASSRVRGLVRG